MIKLCGGYVKNARWRVAISSFKFCGSLGIAPTRNCTHILKIGIVVAGGGFYSYYIQQGNTSDKERIFLKKKLSFMHTKRFNTFVHFRMGAIPNLPSFVSAKNTTLVPWTRLTITIMSILYRSKNKLSGISSVACL